MFSIILPIDANRLEQFANTKRVYDEMPQVKEFIMPTRSYREVNLYLKDHKLDKDVNLVEYEHERGFNPSKAFNIGVRESQYDQVIISSPEVKPEPDLLAKLEKRIGENVLCTVSETDEKGENGVILVAPGYRDDTPAMYFLAMLNKRDIELINGWDEDFMLGYAYEDNDFGDRWVRAKLPFVVDENITGVHQWHPRAETIHDGLNINARKYHQNTEHRVIRCKNGLNVL